MKSSKKSANKVNNRASEFLDVAIIGGGVAGLYTAWRLKVDQDGQKNQQIKIRIFEATKRLGGRLLSVQIPGVGIPAELGAMRYSSRHRLLVGLIQKLGLRRKSFDVPEPAFYIRGRRLPSGALRHSVCHYCSAPIPFYLRDEEKGKLPGELIIDAIWKALSDLNFSDSGVPHQRAARILESIYRHEVSKKEDWDLIREHGRFKDVHLYDIGFWNLLQHFLSNEAFLLIHDGLGYESIVGNWNAAEAVPWFINDFDPNQHMLMLPGGFQGLTKELESKIIEAIDKETIQTSHQLKSVARIETGSDHLWQLKFEDGSDYTARNIILALPRKALEKLNVEDGKGGAFQKWEHLKPKLGAVSSQRLFKLFLVYEHPWWDGHVLPGGWDGRVFTDLPIRQVYYFGPEWIKQHATEELITESQKHFQTSTKGSNISLVMASYSDSHYVTFWHPFSPKRLRDSSSNISEPKYYRRRPDLYTKEADQKILELVEENGASERMVLKVQQQLAELHGIPMESIPDPVASVFMDWGQETYEGGWHTWDVHEKPWEFIKNDLTSLCGDGLYICGEAYSKEQGWVEGALRSTEQVLKGLALHNSTLINYTRPRWSSISEEDFNEYIE